MCGICSSVARVLKSTQHQPAAFSAPALVSLINSQSNPLRCRCCWCTAWWACRRTAQHTSPSAKHHPGTSSKSLRRAGQACVWSLSACWQLLLSMPVAGLTRTPRIHRRSSHTWCAPRALKDACATEHRACLTLALVLNAAHIAALRSLYRMLMFN